MKVYCLLACVLILSACSAHYDGSYVGENLPNHQLMVDRVGERLAAVYPPGFTCFYLGSSDSFGTALENKLRSKGFKLGNEADSLKLDYIVDQVDSPLIWYVSIRLSDGFTFAQVYDLSAQPRALGGMTQIVGEASHE